MRPVSLILLIIASLCVACGEPLVTSESSSEETPTTPAATSTPDESPQNDTTPVDEADASDDINPGDDSPAETSGERLPSTGDAHRDAAQEFALDILQTYFDNDADTWERYVHDPLYLAGTNTVYERSEYTDMMLDPAQFPAGHDLTSYTMDDYLRVYDAAVYTFQEASDNFGLPIFDEDAWIPEDNEFLFLGFFRADGVPYTEEFMPVGLVIFVVGKRDGAWKIIGLIPPP